MFAAAATVAQMAFDAAVISAKFLATRVLLIALMGTMLPWVLKGVYIWGFEYLVTYGSKISDYMLSQISSATAGNFDVNIHLTGIGGYLAEVTGLIDYCSIIFTGWGIYWVVAVLAKTTRVI
jgi:hypothetical protein